MPWYKIPFKLNCDSNKHLRFTVIGKTRSPQSDTNDSQWIAKAVKLWRNSCECRLTCTIEVRIFWHYWSFSRSINAICAMNDFTFESVFELVTGGTWKWKQTPGNWIVWLPYLINCYFSQQIYRLNATWWQVSFSFLWCKRRNKIKIQ